MFKSLQTDLAVAAVLLAGALVVLLLVIGDLGGTMPRLPASTVGVQRSTASPPIELGQRLFDSGAIVSPVPAAELPDGFLTTHFQPAPAPVVLPPTTRKLKLTYLGFLQAGEGPRMAVVAKDGSQWIGGVGSNLAANVLVSSVEPHELVVTNTEGQTNALPFRVEATLEVPLP